MWTLIKMLLDKNGSNAWNKFQSTAGLFNSGKSVWERYTAK